MFTGLVESMGTVVSIRKGRASAVLEIEDRVVTEDLKTGDSVAVNGVCLTAVTVNAGGGRFTADVMHETLNRSSLGSLRPGSRVNLERAMKADGRFGGHIVAGHADGTGVIRQVVRDDIAVRYTIAADPKILRYIIEKGSIAVDGISLTVAALEADSFTVSVIPHTAAATTLSEKRAGDRVNLENDLVGKYVERLLGLNNNASDRSGSRITASWLKANGF